MRAEFFERLGAGGALRVPGPAYREVGAGRPTDATDAPELDQALCRADAAARLEMPGRSPTLDLAAARWAVGRMMAACQALVYRELDEAVVRETLGVPCPAAASPSACYSVDLAMRRLPEVYALALGLAEEDPLVDGLATLARAWPLSSVGVRLRAAAEFDVSSFIEDPSLRRLYADRVIERGDVSRLTDGRVVDAVGEAVGEYPGVAPGTIVAVLGRTSG